MQQSIVLLPDGGLISRVGVILSGVVCGQQLHPQPHGEGLPILLVGRSGQNDVEHWIEKNIYVNSGVTVKQLLHSLHIFFMDEDIYNAYQIFKLAAPTERIAKI